MVTLTAGRAPSRTRSWLLYSTLAGMILGVRPAASWAQAVRCDRSSLTIDIRTGMVGGVALDVRADSLERSLGTERVSRRVEHLEGEASPLFTIDVCGHPLTRHWNGLSWRDPEFKTVEGVGVGRALAAFDTAYGTGKALWSEAGVVVAYRYDDRELFATIAPSCVEETESGPPLVRGRDCRVEQVWIPLQTMPE